MKKLLFLSIALLMIAPLAHAQLGTTAPTGTLAVTVAAEAGLTVNTSTTSLTSSGTNFSDYLGTTSLTYYIRTKESGGSGSIVVKVTTDFSDGTGNTPSVANPPTASDPLTYTSTVSSPGTAAAANLVASTTATTSVGTFGTAAHSVKAGNSASVAWKLPNDPLYPTGAYTATVTFTINAV